MRLKVMDVPWNLIGSKEIVINTDSKDFVNGDVIKIWSEGKITVATIKNIDQSNKNTIRLVRGVKG